MALSNAEKQRRWRERHIKRRRDALRVASLLMRRNWPDGHVEAIARQLWVFFNADGIARLRRALKPITYKDRKAHNAAQWQWRQAAWTPQSWADWERDHPGKQFPEHECGLNDRDTQTSSDGSA